MKITDKLKERFVRDCKIPIKVYDEPYFTERIYLLDKYYDTITKWSDFVVRVEKFNSEEDYFAMYNSTKEAAMSFIKSRPGYERFNKEDMNQFAVKNKNFPSKDIFKPTFIGRSFISIDIKKANFSALNLYDPTIFDNAETWEDFLRKFTDDEYIINSKYIREVIMGNCNPSRVITYEKYITDGILSELLYHGIDNLKIVFFSNDEIVIDITDLSENTKSVYLDTVNMVCKNAVVPLKVEMFTLSAAKKNNSKIIGYIKNYNDGTYEFKCFTNHDLLLAIRTINNEAIKQSDLVFENEGFLAQYIDTPIINFISEVE